MGRFPKRVEKYMTEKKKIWYKEWYKRTNRKELDKKYAKEHPEKTRARYCTRKAIKDGKIIKPAFCDNAGCMNTSKLEAHHYLGYSEEHKLDVIFLCKKHHSAAHEKNRICEKDGCNRKHYAGGICKYHYSESRGWGHLSAKELRLLGK